jgi:hypothetical protein
MPGRPLCTTWNTGAPHDLAADRSCLAASIALSASAAATGPERYSFCMSIKTRQASPAYLCGDLLADPRLRATPVPRRRDTWLLIQSHLKGNSARPYCH